MNAATSDIPGLTLAEAARIVREAMRAEPVTVLPLHGGGMTFVLDDGTELRFHRSEWNEVISEESEPE